MAEMAIKKMDQAEWEKKNRPDPMYWAIIKIPNQSFELEFECKRSTFWKLEYFIHDGHSMAKEGFHGKNITFSLNKNLGDIYLRGGEIKEPDKPETTEFKPETTDHK